MERIASGLAKPAQLMRNDNLSPVDRSPTYATGGYCPSAIFVAKNDFTTI